MVFERLSRAFTKLTLSTFEPAIPVFATYFLSKELERWEKEGSILNFKIKTGRVEKRHYTLDLELDLTEEQARKKLSNLPDNFPIDFEEVMCNG